MEPIVSSETSAIKSQTPGNYPKRNKLHLQHGESLRTRLNKICHLLIRATCPTNIILLREDFRLPTSECVVCCLFTHLSASYYADRCAACRYGPLATHCQHQTLRPHIELRRVASSALIRFLWRLNYKWQCIKHSSYPTEKTLSPYYKGYVPRSD